jgi:hypothetical protein
MWIRLRNDEKIHVEELLYGQKMYWSKNVLVEKCVGRKMCWSKNVLVEKCVGRKCVGREMCQEDMGFYQLEFSN